MVAVKKDNKLMALLSVWGILLVLLGHSGFEESEIQQHLGWLHWGLVVWACSWPVWHFPCWYVKL